MNRASSHFRLVLLLGSTAALHAAQITWDPVTNVSAPSDVSNIGTTVEAINAGGSSVTDVTVNGVAFTGSTALLSLDTTIDVHSGTTGNTNYDALLSSIEYGGGDNIVSLTVGGGLLTPGNPYQIRFVFFYPSKSHIVA